MTISEWVPAITVILTTVLAALLAYVFQNRSWDHQHQVNTEEKQFESRRQLVAQEQERAVLIFDEISRLMDKRLYRLRLIYWRMKPGRDNGSWPAEARERFEEYRQVLYEWNDAVNRNLALVQRYFGPAMRHRLDFGVGASFAALGRTMEEWWKSGQPPDRDDVPVRLSRLSNLVYSFNLDMIGAIQAGKVGAVLSDAHEENEQASDVVIGQEGHELVRPK